VITLQDILDGFIESINEELETNGLAEWSISSAGKNFFETFKKLPTEDIRDLIEEIEEGLILKLEIDLTDHILPELESLIEDRDQIEEEYEDD